MQPNGDPTPRASRWTDRRLDIDVRPIWLAKVGFALFVTGFLLAMIWWSIDLGSASGIYWKGVTFVVMAVVFGLSCIFLAIIPGALVALRHPWGDAYLRLSRPPFVYPRLFGLTLLWAGLLLTGLMGSVIFLSDPAWSWPGTLAILLAIGTVAVVPLAAVFLFDRGREPPGG